MVGMVVQHFNAQCCLSKWRYACLPCGYQIQSVVYQMGCCRRSNMLCITVSK